ncbi:glycosyltransferase family 2 protein [Christiangramia sp. ASW11-125]|uniref:glycosyltransferase family 2 protein n=1 Tax=Christiangramia sp. ASW11-125 TaxID=3400701 RepID=UPI003AAC476B
MLFSILVANFNNGRYLTECFRSIIDQEYKEWEVIIVDDKSTDNSLKIINEYINKDERFKLYTNSSNRGCGYTKNKCAQFANGQILGFLDPDDTLTPNALKMMVKFHKEKPEVSIITSKYRLFKGENETITICDHAGSIPEGESYLSSCKPLLTSFATFKKKFYKDTIGINPALKRAVDQDLYLKMEEVGDHFFLDEILYNYRSHERNISRNENSLKAEYWHTLVIRNSYFRRIKIKSQNKNLTKSQLEKVFCDYYFKLLKSSFHKSSIKLILKFLFLFTQKFKMRTACWYFLFQFSRILFKRGNLFRRKFIVSFNNTYSELGYTL